MSTGFQNKFKLLSHLAKRDENAKLCWTIVSDFFAEQNGKDLIWFWTNNPLLGNISPIEMLMLGRSDKLLKFLENSQLGNRIP